MSSASSVDELVRLHHGPTPHISTGRYIRHVTYTHVEEIPRLLNADSLGLFNVVVVPSEPGPPTASLPVDESTVSISPAQADHRVMIASTPSPAEDNKEEIAVEPPVENAEEIVLAINAEEVVDSQAPSTEKLHAAMTFATFYRRRTERQSGRKKKTSEETRLRIYATFLEESKKFESSHRYYRLLFLGPLPHLFAVVESIKNHLHDAKNNAKKKLNIVQHLELENMGSSLTEITYVCPSAAIESSPALQLTGIRCILQFPLLHAGVSSRSLTIYIKFLVLPLHCITNAIRRS